MTYIFDFDGVLADTFEPYVEYISKRFFMSRERVTKLIMDHTLKNDRPKMYEKMLEMFSMAGLEKFLKDRPNILFQDRIDELVLLDGKKIILSRNLSQFVKDIMADYIDHFELVIGLDNAENKTIGFVLLRDTYGVDLSDSVFITDTVGDVLEAQPFLANDRILAVTWGYHSPDLFKQYFPDQQFITDFKRLHLK
jgi:phosphoglycolate phosphatase-like HAD superfamily hydrolase